MLELLPKVGPFLIFFEGILNLFFNVVLVESLDVGQSTEHVEHFVETWIPVKKKTLKPLITNILPNCRVKIKPAAPLFNAWKHTIHSSKYSPFKLRINCEQRAVQCANYNLIKKFIYKRVVLWQNVTEPFHLK